jgi:hypothetical protein
MPRRFSSSAAFRADRLESSVNRARNSSARAWASFAASSDCALAPYPNRERFLTELTLDPPNSTELERRLDKLEGKWKAIC